VSVVAVAPPKPPAPRRRFPLASRPHPLGAGDERERGFGHAQSCCGREVVAGTVQPPKETSAELFERLAAVTGRDGEHVRQPSPRRVGIIAVRCDLDLRQEVGAEALDDVARELVPGW
jgi:hypothetical protein